MTKTNVSSVSKKCSLAGLVALAVLKINTIRSTKINNLLFQDLPNPNADGCSYLCIQSAFIELSRANLADIHQGSIMVFVSVSSSDGMLLLMLSKMGSESAF